MARPRLPQGVIWRTRLAEMIDVGARHAVTLICAGPGWGKTALASAWAGARSMGGPIAWMSCEAGHNDPYVFWSDLILALRTSGAVRPGTPIPDRGPVLSVDAPAFLRRLGSGLATMPSPVVVILDDLQEIRDPRVLDGLGGLIRNPPERLRLVLISRAEPDLPLHRLRAAGELTEIKAHDLAFRVDEAGELLALRGRRLPVDRLAELVRGTEGWAAGLRLALDAPAGVGPDEAAADYLVREVLAGQPPEVREFLLWTSVPDRVSGALAEALTGRRNGEQLLAELERANLFLERVGTNGWFRYHRQFRAALRRQLLFEQNGTVSRLHLLAAQWHARVGNPLAALNHAATAGDWQLVGRLVVDYGMPLFGSSDRTDIAALLQRIPAERLDDSAELAFCAVLRTYALGDVAGVAGRVAHCRAMLADRSAEDRRVIGLALDMVEAVIVFRWRGDMPRLVDAFTEVLAELGRLRWDQVPAMPQYRALALLNKGIGMIWTDRFDHADRYLWAAATGARAAGVPIVEISAFGHLALLSVIQGSMVEAREHVAAAVGVARRIDAEDRAPVAAALLAQAVIDQEQGREAEAEESLRRALHASGEQPEAALAVLTGVIRAYLLIDRGEANSARALLGVVAEEAGPGLVAPILQRILDVAHSEIDLARGRPNAVLDRYAGRAGLYPAEQLRVAQAWQAAGLPARAEELLARVREGTDRLAAVSAWLLTALAADAQGRGQRAADAMARALAGAEPEHLRRPFRRFDADRVLVLAERQQWLTESPGPSGESVLAEITGEIPIIGGPAAGPLSEREIDVLQYLPTVLTAGEIAENLGISVNTVKAHMRSIYRKLGAGRRREAVVTARQLGLL
ncbi:LuxR family maltose regulon positive regulatory protein [Actinoplanes octamycinicus]|uniref:LuxR family maltose regulon positive regulatory protein n=1 Tax=Actinoplanes octamycinicus TaxID=135948 RepID=A0A7W7GXK0_9ACTN|nr:LuxR C-terminal-related transcriptional regulator [Actinoplanes octamycinicus]MBB4740121.1 LuxR family maltose regulon positive regulatory protein [Actinoplanes octamycinicus]